MELTLTPMSHSRAVRLLSAAAQCGGKRKPVTKVHGRGLTALAVSREMAEKLYLRNEAFEFSYTLPDGFVLGPDDEISLHDLRTHGVRTLMVRCNANRDLVTVSL